jgi:hypothetical protein
VNEEQKTKLTSTMEYALGRLKEPSTWAGIAVMVGMFGVSGDTVDRMTSNGPAIVTAIATLIAIFAPSRGTKAVAVARDAQATALDAKIMAAQATNDVASGKQN